MTLDQMRAAFDAFERDGRIAFRSKDFPVGPIEVTDRPVWNFEKSDYFPVPKPFECWVNLYVRCDGQLYFLRGFDTQVGAKSVNPETILSYARTVLLREVTE